jgi:hypothetical protein
MNSKNPQKQIQTRLQLMKSGFKTFVSSIKIPMSAETKWTLEIVCLNNKVTDLDAQQNPNPPITLQAKNYLQNHLWNIQTNINQNKQTWLSAMKNS